MSCSATTVPIFVVRRISPASMLPTWLRRTWALSFLSLQAWKVSANRDDSSLHVALSLDSEDLVDRTTGVELSFEPNCDGPSLPSSLLQSTGLESEKGSILSDVFTGREAVWFLMHRELLPQEIGVRLLDSFHTNLTGYQAEQAAARTGIDPSGARIESAAWLTTMVPMCSSQQLCRAIATTMAHTDESKCPIGYLLPQAQSLLQLEWRRRLLSRSSAAFLETTVEKSTADHAASVASDINASNVSSTAAQLAVRHWGRGLLASLRSQQHTCGQPSAAPSPPQNIARAADAALSDLVAGLANPDADLLHLVRTFIRVAQAERAVQTTRTTSHADNLLPLLRLLQEQRAQATVASVVRDAVLADFYEPRVQALEIWWARVAGGCDAKEEEPDGPKVELQSQIDALQSVLHRLAADHEVALPTDGGSLPAYWTGRLQRLSRQLEDRRNGRDSLRPSILIWTCSYGGGHLAAARALEGYLPDFNILVSDPTKDQEFYEGDSVTTWIRRFVAPNWDITYPFNEFVLRDRHYGLQSTFDSFMALRGWFRGDGTRFARPCPAPTCDTSTKRLMRRALLRAAPDFVITVYHMDLVPISELCADFGRLPLLHLATDADAKMWEVFGQRPAYANFRVGLPFDAKESWKTIKPLDPQQVFVSGYPVRVAFLRPLPTEEDRAADRARRGVPAGAKVALIMSGSEGQSVPWPLQLANSMTWDTPLHIIVVAAEDQDFGAQLEEHLLSNVTVFHKRLLRGINPKVTLEVAKNPSGAPPFFLPEDEVASLMDVADVLVTKAGGSTSAEAAYRGLPMLFDATSGMLHWEEFNARLFEANAQGERIITADSLEPLLWHTFKTGRVSDRRMLADHATGNLVDPRQRIRQEIQNMMRAARHG